jgi:hypothetical protein
MSRPDEGLIHAWLDGELDAAEAARVERLVRDDAAWAAAAADARGFIAASDRILRSLDDVPANVVPAAGATPPAAPDVIPIAAARAPDRRMPWWTMRVAALLVVAVGVTIVVRRSPDDVTGTRPPAQSRAAPAAPTVTAAPQAAPRATQRATGQAAPQAQRKPAPTAARTAEADQAPAAPAPEARALIAPQAAKAKEATNAPANVVAALAAAAGERRAAAAPEVVCYRAQGGAAFRTQRLSDSTVARLTPEATGNARMDTPPLRVRGDTVFLVPTGVAFRVSCPATP